MIIEDSTIGSKPAKWIGVRLGDIATTTSGGTPSRKVARYFGGEIPWLKSGELNNGTVRSAEETITKEGLENSSSKILPKGTLLIALYGATVGKLGILGFDAAINQAICAIITPEEIDRQFLFWFLGGYRNELLNARIGGAQPNISQQVINDIKLPLPPLPEQHRIVAKIEELFSDLEAGVEALKKVKTELKRYRQAVLKAAVEGKLTEEWRRKQGQGEGEKGRQGDRENEGPGDESVRELLERIRAERAKNGKAKKLPPIDTSDLPKLPDGWEWCYLSELGELSRGMSKHRPRDAEFLYGGKYPFVQTGDIKNSNGVISSYRQTYSEEGLKQSRLWPRGTLCITIAANIADTAILGIEACFPDSVVGFIGESSLCSIEYVHFYLKTVKQKLDSLAPATAQKNINVATLNRVMLGLPPLAEQQEIVSEVERRLSAADEVERTIEAGLKQAERLRQSILKRAFEGRLVPQDPNGPPASELLEKIKNEREKRKNKAKKTGKK